MKIQFKSFILFLIWILLGGCFSAPHINKVSNFQFEGYQPKLNKIDFSVNMNLTNPNGLGFKIRPSKMHVFIGDDQYIGQGIITERLRVKNKTSASYFVPVSLLLEKGAFIKLTRLVFSKTVNIKLEGYLKYSVLAIPLRKKVVEERKVNVKDLNLNFGAFM